MKRSFNWKKFNRAYGVYDVSVTMNVGKVRYATSYWDGVSTHNDGSRFRDLICFGNKKDLNRWLKSVGERQFV
jgi:hypothetical protein